MTHTSTQPEALRLADSLEQFAYKTAKQSAAELRRQHVRIEELEDATDIAIERIAELEAQLSAIGAVGAVGVSVKTGEDNGAHGAAVFPAPQAINLIDVNS